MEFSPTRPVSAVEYWVAAYPPQYITSIPPLHHRGVEFDFITLRDFIERLARYSFRTYRKNDEPLLT